MPWASVQQAKWGHSPSGLLALGGKKKVAEWDSATEPGSLPERKEPMEKKKPEHWIQGAVKHPGALSKAAAAHGVSKLQEAEKESHSPDPSIRARGALGKRFIKGKI